jgi:hypothetical protein
MKEIKMAALKDKLIQIIESKIESMDNTYDCISIDSYFDEDQIDEIEEEIMNLPQFYKTIQVRNLVDKHHAQVPDDLYNDKKCEVLVDFDGDYIILKIDLD